ncbi:MAG: signal peptidase II [Candidatus Endonucleobacter sp. (ex Gigantidas childressi)]|nr:signal peptidase II [Candidatus Endonucleobacter sp. (ex Gigantidas childressi)]
MKNIEAGMLRWLWLSGLVWVLDQTTKWLAVHEMHLYEQITVLPIFSLTLAYNTGAAFSFLSDESGWQRWFLSAISIIVSFMLARWLWYLKKHEVWQSCAVALILGGAMGNLFDRLFHGYVIDFILIHYDQFYFPAFNIADSAITIGAAMLVLDMFRGHKPGHE